MRLMGLEAMYPKPRLSLGRPGSQDLSVPVEWRGRSSGRTKSGAPTSPTSACGMDLSTWWRSWTGTAATCWPGRLSITMEDGFCVAALDGALRRSGRRSSTRIRASQFTSAISRSGFWRRKASRISMDGRGRVFDNIFVERLWRTVKYEDIYLKDYADVPMLIGGLGAYFDFYNRERPHQSLGYRTPASVYYTREGRN